MVDSTDEIYVLRVELLGLEPTIWREVAVPGSATLVRLHRIIQVLMDWEDAHLHEFVFADGTRFERKSIYIEPDLEARDSRRMKVAQAFPEEGTRVLYRYDFGDDWHVGLTLLRREAREPGLAYPRCLAGEYAGPPEDSGGIHGYADLLTTLSDPEDPEYREQWAWVGDDFNPFTFEIDVINEELASMK